MNEVHEAVKNNVKIVPIRIDTNLPHKNEQWVKQSASKHPEDLLKVSAVKKHMAKINSVPARGSFLEQLDAELPKLIELIRRELGHGGMENTTSTPIEHCFFVEEEPEPEVEVEPEPEASPPSSPPNLRNWTTAHVVAWLTAAMQLPDVAAAATSEGVDGGMAIELGKDEWKELGATGLKAAKIVSELKKLQ